MIQHNFDIAVIGSGPAGLAAAVSARENGAKKVLIIDRNNWRGGILSQCIHDGFGVEETGKSMTGPEYVDMYLKKAEEKNIDFMLETMVLSLNKKHEITALNKKGIHKIKAKSIVLAMGCREKTRWNIMIPGDRPSGIYTAGVAQAFINLYNIMPGKKIVILGSGDVGLIMARRLKFEGAKIQGVVEILPFASGLPRNVVQCLDDYDIPLLLNHTVTQIIGRGRLESVIIAQVDENMKIIHESQRKIKCDTLLLSLGLIPENELSKNIGIKLDKMTGGPLVDQFFETNISGIFACGNCLQVYDTVDVLSIGAKQAGMNAALKPDKNESEILVKPGKGVRYVIPQRITKSGTVNFTMRALKPDQSVRLIVNSEDEIIYRKKLRWINPANMIEMNIDITEKVLKSGKNLEVSINA
jgi:NADPH-dependent 2,4-dienoyl-CoA reductase/sulfur reductase-like enzyme